MAELKLANDYSYIAGRNIIVVPAGTIVSGDLLERLRKVQPSWLVPVDAEIEAPVEKGRIKDLRLTADEKPSPPKDEDPKDPDKKKKL